MPALSSGDDASWVWGRGVIRSPYLHGMRGLSRCKGLSAVVGNHRLIPCGLALAF